MSSSAPEPAAPIETPTVGNIDAAQPASTIVVAPLTSASPSAKPKPPSKPRKSFKQMCEPLKGVWNVLKWVLLVVLVFAVLAAVSAWNIRRSKTYTKEELERIRSLLEYSAKSAEEAERTERDDPLQALLHANYAICYLNASKHIVDEKAVESLLGAHVPELEHYLKQLQHRLLDTVYNVMDGQQYTAAVAAASSSSTTPSRTGDVAEIKLK